MPKSRNWPSWATLFGVIAAIEFVTRFAHPLSLRRVLVVEAVLFSGAALVTLAMVLRPPHRSGWRRVLQWALVWAFVLAALRAAIWAAGQPVTRANLAIFLLAIGVLIGSWMRRRHHAAQPPQN